MTITRTAANTIVTTLNTVNTAVLTVGKVIDSAASGIDMLDKYVQRAKSRQNDTHLVEDSHWRRNLILDAAAAQEKIETDLIKEFNSDPARQQRFQTIEAELIALFAPAAP